MKHTNKKGFTIVELVIVIAVIAILAAVLIPTFTNLIKKAKISSDTQLAKNLNTALTSEEVLGNIPTTFAEVIDILRDNGYIVANLNPTQEGNFYAWDEVTNQILYIDEEFNVIYHSKDLDESSKTANPKWHIAVSTEEARQFAESKGVTVSLAPKSYEFMTQLNNMINGSVVLTEDITVTANADAEKLIVANGANISVNLAGSKIVINEADQVFNGNRAFTVDGGKLVISGGTVNAANSTTGTNGSYGAIRVNGGDAQVTDMILSNNRNNGMNIKVLEGGTATIGGKTEITSERGGCVESGGIVTITGGTFNQVGAPIDWCSTVLAVCSGGELIVTGGTFNGANDVISVFSSGGTIKIQGGTFNLGDGTPFALTTAADADADSVVEITGGTFGGKAWDQFTEAEWIALCGGNTPEVEIVKNAGQVVKVILTLAKPAA